MTPAEIFGIYLVGIAYWLMRCLDYFDYHRMLHRTNKLLDEDQKKLRNMCFWSGVWSAMFAIAILYHFVVKAFGLI